MMKTVGVNTTLFAYDEAGKLLGEYDGAGTVIQETVWLGDTPLAVLNPTGTYYVHADHLNTPRQINDGTGTAVWTWDIATFGASAPNENPSGLGTFTYNLRFPGQYYDAETGLHYNLNRDYDPKTGRYVESDPIGQLVLFNLSRRSLLDSFGKPRLGYWNHLYAYAKNNAISNTDPTGLGPLSFAACTAANGVYIGYSFYQAMKELDSTSLLQDQIIRVNKRISECPFDDTKRMKELSDIRDNLEKALAESLGRTASSENSAFGLKEAGTAAVVEGICWLLLVAPTP